MSFIIFYQMFMGLIGFRLGLHFHSSGSIFGVGSPARLALMSVRQWPGFALPVRAGGITPCLTDLAAAGPRACAVAPVA
ncbi:hypothetical protein ABTP36_19480, partial [Acinetobacter baumannii]